MATEIERKFLVEVLPDARALGPGTALRQGYLAEENDVEVRIRMTNDSATLTIKAGIGLVRTEVELPLPMPAAEALWPVTAGRRVAKVRHHVAAGDAVADIDVYAEGLTGLSTAEVEFPTIGAAAAFTPPAWFGREITGDPGWGNASLARRGLPT